MSLAEELGFDFSSEPCETFPFSRFPCRKCIPCLRRRQQEWVARLTEELRHHEGNYFVTLTYEESKIPIDDNGEYCFDNKRIIKLHRDLRKRFQEGFFRNPAFEEIIDSPEYLDLPHSKIKYYLTSEYGPNGTHRSHYHAIYYGLGVDLYTAELLFRLLWPDGHITVYPAQEGAAGYISKYLCKDVLEVDSYNDKFRQSPIAIMSKGLGADYIDRMKSWHNADPMNRTYYQYHGEKKCLSRYYKKKLFSDQVRDELADRYFERSGALKEKYEQLRISDQVSYLKVLEERRKYFSDLKESERWNMLKKANKTL